MSTEHDIITVKQKIPVEVIAKADPKLGWPTINPPIAEQARLQEELMTLRIELHIALKRVEMLELLIAAKERQLVPF